MKAKSAERFAQALISLATQSREQNKVQKDLEIFSELLKSCGDLERVLFDRVFSLREKEGVLENVLAHANLGETTAAFLKFLVVKNRFDIFYDLREAYDKKKADLDNKYKVEVFSTRELSAEYKKRFLERFEDKLGKKCDIHYQVDPLLLGGVKTKIGNTIFDGSLRTQLLHLEQQLEKGD